MCQTGLSPDDILFDETRRMGPTRVTSSRYSFCLVVTRESLEVKLVGTLQLLILYFGFYYVLILPGDSCKCNLLFFINKLVFDILHYGSAFSLISEFCVSGGVGESILTCFVTQSMAEDSVFTT